MNFGAYCFYCLLTTLLSPVLLWSLWNALSAAATPIMFFTS